MIPVAREDRCSCEKPAGTYGSHGFHWRPDPRWPDYPQADVAIERCEEFQAAVQRRIDQARIADCFSDQRRTA